MSALSPQDGSSYSFTLVSDGTEQWTMAVCGRPSAHSPKSRYRVGLVVEQEIFVATVAGRGYSLEMASQRQAFSLDGYCSPTT